MNVKEKFLELTKQTYPHGTEEDLISILPDFLKQDEFGNLYYQIGENPSTMFTCHLDTASYNQDDVHHVIKGNMIYSDGSTILGADDKAGVVILLYLIENNITGLYYFFLGEERGCIGSRKLASKHSKDPLINIKKVISFDRRGYDSVITHQLSGRSCSDEFAREVSEHLNKVSSSLFDVGFRYSPDPTGIYTDSAQFTSVYSECTNISVGYQNEHTKYESQDINHLNRLCQVVSKIDWEKVNNYRNQNKKYSYDDLWDDDDYHSPKINSYQNTSWKLNENVTSEVTVYDTEFYGHESRIKYDYNTLEILEVKLHPGRLMKEKNRIDKLLTSLELDYQDLKWDGNTLTVVNNSEKDYILKRREIEEYLTDFNDWIEIEIKYNNIS